MTLIRPRGLIPGCLTAFKENYELDEERFRTHLQWLMKQPYIGGLSITSGNGEFYALTFEEWKRCQEIGVEVAHNKVQVWSNFGAESFEKALQMAEAARTAGVDGLRIVHPYYTLYKPSALYDYYRDLARALPDISIMLYPQIGQTNRPFPASIMIKLADIENIVGVKVAGPIEIGELFKLDAFCEGKDFDIVSGSMGYFYHFCRSGIQTKAAIGPEPQVAPELCATLWKACMDQNWKVAKAAVKTIIEIHDTMRPNGAIRAGTKYAMKLVGRPLGPARRPSHLLTPEEMKNIEEALANAGLLKTPIAH